MLCATAIKGTKLLRLTLHWIPQPWCLVIYFEGPTPRGDLYLFGKDTEGAPSFRACCERVGTTNLLLSSELVYFSTIAFRQSTLRRRTENHSRLPFLGCLNSQFAAGFSFLVKRPRDGRGPAHFA
jgi:hypothetical protein